MTGIQSIGIQQPIINLDPRTKLYILLVFSIVSYVNNTSYTDAFLKVIFAIFTFLMLLNVHKMKMAIWCAALYIAALNADYFLQFISGMSVVGVLLRIFIPVVLRMLPGIMVAWCFILSTKVSEFIAAMEKVHVTRKITIPFAVVFRFFPTLTDEYHSIQDAMKMRGVGIRKGIIAMLEYRLVPLIVSIVKIGDELSAAAMTRGLGGDNQRTSYYRIQLRTWDFALILFMSVSLIVFIFF